ncbi:MAG: long-chain fatty acid--CoA ligase [Chloroflexota bacterium]
MNGLMMDYQLTMDRVLEHAKRMYPHKTIKTMLPDGSMHSYTFADAYKRIKRMSKALVNLGVEAGDRVGTFGWNNYQHLELYYAIPGAGAVCHTLNIRLSPEQLAYIINHAEDKVVFIDGTLLKLYEMAADMVETVNHYVIYNAPRDVETKLDNVVFYEDLIDGSDEDFEWRSTDEKMAVAMCYTSGTTGDPKGALYSHRSMFLHTIGSNQANGLAMREDDVVLPVVPQFHAMAWGTPYSCMAAGACLVMPGPHLQPKPLAKMIEEERVTVAAGVPTIWTGLYHELADNPRDISCIRALVVGGSAMPRGLTKQYESELGVNVVHAWGMTEMSPLGTICHLSSHHQELSNEEQWDVKATQGYPILGVEMRIVDDEGNDLAWDGEQMGELQVRGPWIISQYFKRDIEESYMTADGWFRTGDVSMMTSDGYMRITDRTKDLVKSGGEWISSVDLENAIMAHPKVMEAAVIAVPDERWAERPLAAIKAAPGVDDVSQDEILDFLRPDFAKFWLPDRVIVVDDIPKTSTGKFDKKVLRRQHADGEL